MTDFYSEMTTRNIGFISDAEQQRLKDGAVFVVGVGGMGGAAVQMLVRAGVGKIAIADLDTFETSNLNRQLFAFTDTVDRPKAEVTAEGLKRINPELDLTVLGAEWTDKLDELCAEYSVIINGCDDIPATAQLYRKAKQHGATVIDAYASPLPSVIVVRPTDPRPEERLRYPIRGTDWKAITEEQAADCFMKELEWVMTHSSSHTHIDLTAAAEMAAGKRKRMSFAPMVTTAGCLMAGEALALLMGRKTKTDCRGWFMNTRDARCERPLPAPIGALKAMVVRRFMQKLLAG
ncbi:MULTISPECIES: HesA/MoeB/ThiF family protein [unclassified Brevundimonas]|uniref:HesA/MoeB/ThiF family protein n=1 Tax=unclassified Brevundimonas TaxID=2622653 RepID=UPI0025BD29E5|nr:MULTISPECIES: ThiF family adenylyltransferase [unclassified Brevundimonas]